jgi:hypothetical protein
MTEYFTWPAFEAAAEGYYLDPATDILYAKFADTGGDLEFTFGGVPIPDIPGDYDRDTDVDQEDFGHFQRCLAGAGVSIPTGCDWADLDTDSDVDDDDTTLFEGCMTRPGETGDEHCAD